MLTKPIELFAEQHTKGILIFTRIIDFYMRCYAIATVNNYIAVFIFNVL